MNYTSPKIKEMNFVGNRENSHQRNIKTFLLRKAPRKNMIMIKFLKEENLSTETNKLRSRPLSNNS